MKNGHTILIVSDAGIGNIDWIIWYRSGLKNIDHGLDFINRKGWVSTR
ncbi:hypothetical protein [Lentibacillus daqui]|nr:hypothetical protein [Lentibacillus daqui]